MKKWIKAATVRAVKTAAQAAIGVIGAATVFNAVDWRIVGGTVLLATISSFLTSLAGLPEVKDDTDADRLPYVESYPLTRQKNTTHVKLVIFVRYSSFINFKRICSCICNLSC